MNLKKKVHMLLSNFTSSHSTLFIFWDTIVQFCYPQILSLKSVDVLKVTTLHIFFMYYLEKKDKLHHDVG